MRRRSTHLHILLPLALIGIALNSCVPTPPPHRTVSGPPLINPLPIPDLPNRPRYDDQEPAEVALLFDDAARAAALCRDGTGQLAARGTLFGHSRFDEPSADQLTAAPVALAGGSCLQVHSAMTAPLAEMIWSATVEHPAIGSAIIAVSCHRSIARQAALFCDAPRVAQRGYAEQARWIAPPGFSEHATGLSIDFGSRTQGQCDLRPCFATTSVGRWLTANAARFGFEMSFPAGNAQGVAYEPWHYRYVGSGAANALFSADGSLTP